MPTIHRYLVHKMTLNRSMSSTGILYFFISQSFIQPGLIWNLKKKPDWRHINGPTRTSVSAKSNVVSDMIWAASTWKSQMDFKICGKLYCASVLNSLELMINSKRVWRINFAETLLSSLQGYRNILAKTFSAQTDQVRNRFVETKLLIAHTLSCVAPTFLRPVCIYDLVSFPLKF